MLVLVSLTLTACSGKSELNEILIISSMGIDQDGDEIVVHLQVVNPIGQQGSGQSGGSGGAVYTYTVKGDSLYDAIKQANNILPRKVMFSHVTNFIVGEEFASESGISPLFDFMERNNQIRDNVLLFVAKDATAKEILSMYTPIFKNPGESLKNRVKIAAASTGIAEGIRQKEIINWTYGDFRDPVIQGVELLQVSKVSGNTSTLENINANDKTFKITGLALFDRDYLTGWYDDNQALGWAMADNRAKESVIVTTKCENQDGYLGFLVKHLKSTVKPIISNGNITFQIEVTGTSILEEITCNMDVNDPKIIVELEKLLEASLKENIESAVEKSKDLEIDVFGFGKMVYEIEPQMWKEKYEKEWHTELANVTVEPVITIRIESVGARVKTIHEQE